MRKKVFGRRLKRDANERKALFKSLMSSLVMHGRIKTTEAKAKAIKGQIEKLVTKARGGNSVTNALQVYLTPPSIIRLINEVSPQFANRPGGYTRIIRLSKRFSDDAQMVLLEWVEEIRKVPQVSKVSRVSKEEPKSTKTLSKEKETRSTTVRKVRTRKAGVKK